MNIFHGVTAVVKTWKPHVVKHVPPQLSGFLVWDGIKYGATLLL